MIMKRPNQYLFIKRLQCYLAFVDLDFTAEVPFKFVKFKRGLSRFGNDSALRLRVA